ncbi:hypothetical protein MG290_08910 [Flavobacterium sp. CBA20B-1]|uniref:hypothetical protein n=1 Tax=unclassified Flavobacterium TaxID=196869 RepID=UPI0022254FB7|nr:MULTISPECIES: hypothetical protein [unclassified Flavobacterium]WCM41075.1 hypothetical protein MG290_08910 [Flavobacterium sp. CBA20B-1]
MVYTFASGCSSEFCKPLYVYENWAQKNNYKLFLVMVSYANLDYTLQEIYDSQLYVIDSHYFKESRFRSYVSYFENELQGLDRYAKDKTIGNLFFFENGVFVKNMRELPRE